MPLKVVDIVRKHQGAIEDLVQVGIVDAKVCAMVDAYVYRRVVGLSEIETAEKLKCSKRTVSRYLNRIETIII